MAVKPVKKTAPQALKAVPAPDERPSPGLPDDETRRKIAEVAYYRAQQRGFSPGYELEDWLVAEEQVMSGSRAGA